MKKNDIESLPVWVKDLLSNKDYKIDQLQRELALSRDKDPTRIEVSSDTYAINNRIKPLFVPEHNQIKFDLSPEGVINREQAISIYLRKDHKGKYYLWACAHGTAIGIHPNASNSLDVFTME